MSEFLSVSSIKKKIMKDLTTQELKEINGGSPESYAAGVEVGRWIRKQVDNSGIIYAILVFTFL